MSGVSTAPAGTRASTLKTSLGTGGRLVMDSGAASCECPDVMMIGEEVPRCDGNGSPDVVMGKEVPRCDGNGNPDVVMAEEVAQM